jgi:hypothetical protein
MVDHCNIWELSSTSAAVNTTTIASLTVAGVFSQAAAAPADDHCWWGHVQLQQGHQSCILEVNSYPGDVQVAQPPVSLRQQHRKQQQWQQHREHQCQQQWCQQGLGEHWAQGFVAESFGAQPQPGHQCSS